MKDSYAITTYPKAEKEANQFAMELLMPESKVRAVIELYPKWGIEDLAEYFRVPESAMTIRILQLGYSYYGVKPEIERR